MKNNTWDERAMTERAYALFDVFRRESREMRERAELCRKIFQLEDPEMLAAPPGRPPTPQLHTLKSTIVACVADQLDNTPEAVILPERPELTAVAEDLTDIVRFILEQNAFERLHRQRVMDFFQTGTSIVQVLWDGQMHSGKGDVALLRCPVESFYWDPTAEDIQMGRAVFKASFHPESWYEQHYPEQASAMETDRFSAEERMERQGAELTDDEPQIMLLEYWYRVYDAKTGRYSVHVAYLAGGVVLYASEKERPQGVYAHGLYPFVVDVYTPIEGSPVGNGMIWEFTPMQRYINRYARYIDENARMSAKVRLLVNNAAGIEEETLTDWNANVIRGDNISESALRWFQSQPLSGQVNAQMQSFEQQIKLDSGQNQFARGEAGMGVTAASAIVALQEAGGKTARLHTTTLGEGFRQMVGMMLWLIAQCYDETRTRMITGRAVSGGRTVRMDRARMLGTEGAETKGALPPPPYVAQVQIHRGNPLRIQAQNDFMLKMAQMAAEQGSPLPMDRLLELLQVDGKEKMLPVLREMDAQWAQMEQLAAENEKLGQLLELAEEGLADYQKEMERRTPGTETEAYEQMGLLEG